MILDGAEWGNWYIENFFGNASDFVLMQIWKIENRIDNNNDHALVLGTGNPFSIKLRAVLNKHDGVRVFLNMEITGKTIAGNDKIFWV